MPTVTQTNALSGGFAQPSHDSARAFRAVMEAMARPGTIQQITGATPPAPLSPAMGAVLLCLCDGDTPIHIAPSHDTPAVRKWLAFHTGAPLSAPEDCAFAIGTWEALLPLDRFAMGTPEYPDSSATLIVDLPALTAAGVTLTGPGIRRQAQLSLPDVPALQANARLFPLGRDFILTCGSDLAALPRSTTLSEGAA